MSDNPEQTEYFLRIISMYIDLGTESVLKVFYHHKPKNDVANFLLDPDTRRILDKLKKENVLKKKEYNLVTATFPDPDTFDIALLITLLSTLFPASDLPPPNNGWHSKVDKSDLSVAADLLRLKKIRNQTLFHRRKAQLEKCHFEYFWSEIENVLLRITRNICPYEESDLNEKIQKYKVQNLNANVSEKYNELLNDWEEEINQIQDQVENLLKTLKEFTVYFKVRPERFERYTQIMVDGGQLVLSALLDRELAKRQLSIEELVKKNEDYLKEDELCVRFLFPEVASRSEWDIWVFTRVILHCFDDVTSEEKEAIETIQDARKNYAETARLSLESEVLADYREDLIGSLISLTNGLTKEVRKKLIELIKACKIRHQEGRSATAYVDRLQQKGSIISSLADVHKDTVQKLKSSLNKMESEGIPFKTTQKLEIKLQTSSNNAETAEKVEDTVFIALKEAIEEAVDSTGLSIVREEINKILRQLTDHEGIEKIAVHRECIIITISCSSPSGMLHSIDVFDSDQFRSVLNNISFEMTIEVQDAVAISSNFALDSLHEILVGQNEDQPENRGISIPLDISSAHGLNRVISLFDSRKLTNSVNRIAGSLSSHFDETVTVNISHDLMGLTDSETSMSNSGNDEDETCESDHGQECQNNDESCLPKTDDAEVPVVKQSSTIQVLSDSEIINEVLDLSTAINSHNQISITDIKSNDTANVLSNVNSSRVTQHEEKDPDPALSPTYQSFFEGDEMSDLDDALSFKRPPSVETVGGSSTGSEIAEANEFASFSEKQLSMLWYPKLRDSNRIATTDRYYRLICFVTDVCPSPLRELFMELVRKDGQTTSVEEFLKLNKKRILHRGVGRRIPKYQTDLLYPAHGQVDVMKWDVVLLTSIISDFFKAHLSSTEMNLLDEIRATRNQLQHLSGTTSVTDIEFNTIWNRLETATLAIANKAHGSSYADFIRTKIREIKVSNLPQLGDTLRSWFEDIISEMKSEIVDMKDQVSQISESTTETTSILRAVTIQRPGKGISEKRLKTVDMQLQKMNASFGYTRQQALADNFWDPTDIPEIRTKLRDSHHVVVSSDYGTSVLKTVFMAIEDMGYNIRRCVEMQNSSDWRHIDPEDTDLVLLKNPFGTWSFDAAKSKGMADILNNMLATVKDEENRLDIVIVTDRNILTECKQRYDHELLDEIVFVNRPTTEMEPVDLTHVKRPSQGIIKDNLSDMTSIYLKNYGFGGVLHDKSLLASAKDLFKRHKVLLITGPRMCGKTSFAVEMANCFDPTSVLVLFDQQDVRSIDFQNTCLVLIFNFAGRYRYDINNIYSWYHVFDQLYAAVVAGKLHTIITCETSKAKKCFQEISKHPLLQHIVELPPWGDDVVKQEKDEYCMAESQKEHDSQIKSEATSKRPRRSRRLNDILSLSKIENFDVSRCVWETKDRYSSYKVQSPVDTERCCIVAISILPSGEVMLADYTNKNIKKLDENFRVQIIFPLSHKPLDMKYAGNNVIAILSESSETLKFYHVRDGKKSKEIAVGANYHALYFYGDNVFVINDNSLSKLSIKTYSETVLYCGRSRKESFQYVVVSSDGNKIFVTDKTKGLVTFDNTGKRLYTLSDKKLVTPYGLCLDGNDNLFVCGSKSKTVVQVGPSGRRLLSVVCDDIKSPIALDFDWHKSVLIVSKHGNYITVFNCSKPRNQ